jgi:hypothetical protein
MSTSPKKVHDEHGEPPAYPPTQPMVYTPEAANNNADGSGKGNWLLRRPQSNSKRLIIDFFPASWCGEPIVLAEEVKNHVPPILASRGITDEEWKKWTERLVTTVQSKSWSIGAWIGGFLTCVLLPICWGYALAGAVYSCRESIREEISRGYQSRIIRTQRNVHENAIVVCPYR